MPDIYRTCKNQEVQISRYTKNKIVLGGNVFGYFTDFYQTNAIIDCARELGAMAIDTADVYSEGLSEQYIGECTKQDRSKWFIATKVGLRSHVVSDGLGKKELILTKVEGSLKRLQTDYIDLYQMHHFDSVTPIEETLDAFECLIQQGKIRAAGISNYQRDHLEILKNRPTHCFQVHQTPLNIANFSNMMPVLEECASQNIAIMAYASLARGLLNEKYLAQSIPEGSRAACSQNVQADLTPDFLNRLKQTVELSKLENVSLAQIALQTLNQCDLLTGIIVGCRSIEQMISTCEALESPVTEDCLRQAKLIWSGF